MTYIITRVLGGYRVTYGPLYTEFRTWAEVLHFLKGRHE